MNRRDFFKIVLAGSATLFLSGCGISAVDEKNDSAKKSVSGGQKMKIVLINSSPHSEEQSTSKFLTQKFVEGTKSAGHEIFIFDAANEETNPCKACDQCKNDGDCVFNDAISQKLMPKMLEADLLVFATPLYYYGMSTQLKTVIDRFYSRVSKLNGKKTIFMATAFNSMDWTFDVLKNHYETLVKYMNWQDCGQVWALGCGNRAAVESSEFGDVAYKIGANL